MYLSSNFLYKQENQCFLNKKVKFQVNKITVVTIPADHLKPYLPFYGMAYLRIVEARLVLVVRLEGVEDGAHLCGLRDILDDIHMDVSGLGYTPRKGRETRSGQGYGWV